MLPRYIYIVQREREIRCGYYGDTFDHENKILGIFETEERACICLKEACERFHKNDKPCNGIYKTINGINYDVKRVYRKEINPTEDTFQVVTCQTGINIGFSKYYEMVEEEDV
jgi:hypothetical protein